MFSRIQHRVALSLAVLYGVELLDELIYGLGGAVLPSLKADLTLSYTQVGLLLTLPGLIALAGDPLIGLLGDTRYRRALVVGGCAATGLSLWLTGIAQTFGLILTAFSIMYIASGAYVNLAQATLIDRDPARAEQTMARWTVLGSLGVSAAPVMVATLLALGYGWRGLYLALAAAAGIYTLLLARHGFDLHASAKAEAVSLPGLARELMAALRQGELLRWLVLTELADLMLDKLLEVTGLYFHDVVQVNLAEASTAVAILTGTGLIGSLLVVPLLERVSGTRLLRVTALLVLALYIAFLLAPFIWLRFFLIGAIGFSTSGWFAILQGRTYATLPGQSGLVVAAGALAHVLNLFVPLAIGRAADLFGLAWAMWLLALGPLALILGLPKDNVER
jgi:FSR family fosmidomycin resistance protein-like MFS transporter